MKRFGWILVLLTAALPALSVTTKKITVQELKDMLTSLQQANKSDADVATQLKQTELTEQLSLRAMNGMANLVPGPLTTEQMYVLEARSSMLPPPAADLPTAPAPDAAAQQAMLAKAADYASKSYTQLPHLTASKMTARFQDGMEAVHDSGMKESLSTTSDPLWEQTKLYIRLMNTHTDTIESENGMEKATAAKDKTQWGPNGMVASIAPVLPLNAIVQDATSSGNPKWLRWEAVSGKQVAVYSFAIDKKKSRYGLNYCCFPDTDTAGVLHFSKNQSAAAAAGGGSTARGNLQTSSSWKNFKAGGAYHGELFIDPDTGVIVRTITQAEFKPSDFVHYEYIRTDYASMDIGGKPLVVPIRTYTLAEVVPNGDSFAAHYSVRHDMVTEDFKDYQLAGSSATAQK
jgi:hypothetical protein